MFFCFAHMQDEVHIYWIAFAVLIRILKMCVAVILPIDTDSPKILFHAVFGLLLFCYALLYCTVIKGVLS